MATAATIKCASCGASNPQDAKKCTFCGDFFVTGGAKPRAKRKKYGGKGDKTSIREYLRLIPFNDLKDICTDLDLDPDNLPTMKDAFARELVIRCEQRGLLNDLIRIIKS